MLLEAFFKALNWLQKASLEGSHKVTGEGALHSDYLSFEQLIFLNMFEYGPNPLKIWKIFLSEAFESPEGSAICAMI